MDLLRDLRNDGSYLFFYMRISEQCPKCIKVFNPWDEYEAAFRQAFMPVMNALNRQEAETLVWAVYRAVKNIDHKIPKILDDMFDE